MQQLKDRRVLDMRNDIGEHNRCLGCGHRDRLLARGIHPKVASEMLGHSTIAITLDLYSQVTATLQKEAARALDAMFRGES